MAAVDAVAVARATAACAKAMRGGAMSADGADGASLWAAPLRRALLGRGDASLGALERAMLMKAATGAI